MDGDRVVHFLSHDSDLHRMTPARELESLRAVRDSERQVLDELSTSEIEIDDIEE